MRLRSIIVISFLTAQAAGFFAAPLSASAQVTRTAVIIGDSQANGLHNPLKSALRGAGINVVTELGEATIAGKKSLWFDSQNMVQRMVREHSPQIVILIVGGNDYATTRIGELRTRYENAYRSMVEEARSGGASPTIYWVGPATSRDEATDARHERTTALQREILPSLGVNWIDGRPGSAPGPYAGTQSASAKTHLTAAGYRRWACELAPTIAGTAMSSCDAAADSQDIALPEMPTCEGDECEEEGGAAAPAETIACPEEPASLLPVKLGVALGPVQSVTGIADYINNLYRYLVSIVLICAIVMVVYGGFRYLIGAGISDVQKGKTIIRDAIIGLVIVLAAYTILNTVNPATTTFKILNPQAIKCIPLEIPRNVSENRCESASDCSGGERCVTVGWAFSSFSEMIEGGETGAMTGAAIGSPGLIPGAIAGGAIGSTVGFLNNLGGRIKTCSNGALGSPCVITDSEGCTGSGAVCSTNWNLCIQVSGNPTGSPCDYESQCVSGNCGDDHRCRGQAQTITSEIWVGSGYRVTQETNCFGTRENCQDSEATCNGPRGTPYSMCLPSSDDVELGTPCFIGREGAIAPTRCAGITPTGFVCMLCPPSGDRRWQPLTPQSDPNGVKVGSCRNPSDRNTNCTGD